MPYLLTTLYWVIIASRFFIYIECYHQYSYWRQPQEDSPVKKKNIYTKLNKLVNHFIHWSEIHPAPDTYCHTYKYNCLWPRAIIDWNSILSNYLLIESSSKFKATISDILSFWDFIQFYWKSFSYLFLCSNSCIFVFNV